MPNTRAGERDLYSDCGRLDGLCAQLDAALQEVNLEIAVWKDSSEAGSRRWAKNLEAGLESVVAKHVEGTDPLEPAAPGNGQADGANETEDNEVFSTEKVGENIRRSMPLVDQAKKLRLHVEKCTDAIYTGFDN